MSEEATLPTKAELLEELKMKYQNYENLAVVLAFSHCTYADLASFAMLLYAILKAET